MSNDDPGEPSSPVAVHSELLDVAGLAGYDLAGLAAKLPTGRDAASKRARKALLQRCDASGQGGLVLADADKALAHALDSDGLPAAQPAVARAFAAATDASNTNHGSPASGLGLEGLRMLLTYLRQYFELFAVFQQRDVGFDGRLSLNDFKQGLDQLAKYGTHVAYAEVEAAFDAIDVDGAGDISFGVPPARTRMRHAHTMCTR